MLSVGVSTLLVTLGPRGAIYVTSGGADGSPAGGPIRTALVAAEHVVDPLDPTGCGDVFGGAVFSRLLAGESLETAVAAGIRAGARNLTYRGASGLSRHLRGELVAL
jgi:sugar/nucleoside kinase (ribokinase family)